MPKNLMPATIPAQDEIMLRNVLWTFLFPNTEGMQKRYEDAVSTVAAFLPLLAYDLRSKDAPSEEKNTQGEMSDSPTLQ
jgi:hypothetical protein